MLLRRVWLSFVVMQNMRSIETLLYARLQEHKSVTTGPVSGLGMHSRYKAPLF